MAGPQGKLAVIGNDGLMYLAPAGSVPSGYRPATDDEFAKRTAEKEHEEQFGSGAQQALAAAETVGEAATFGLLPDLPGAADRKAELTRQSPFIQMGAEAVGTVAPALAGGAGAVGAARALGVGARAAGVAGMVAEGAAGGISSEIERTRGTDEAFSGANALMFGVGGELLGRGLGAVVRGSARGAQSILARVETEALEDAAKSGARGGAAARAVALEQNPAKFAAEVREQVTKHVDALKLEELRNPVAKANVDELVPVHAPAHDAWAADVLERAQRLADEFEPEKQLEFDTAPRTVVPDAEASKAAAERVLAEIKNDLGGAGVDDAKLAKINSDAVQLGKNRRKTHERRPGAGKVKNQTLEQAAERRANLEQQAAISRRTPFGASMYPDVPRVKGVGWSDDFALPGTIKGLVQKLNGGLAEGVQASRMFKKTAEVWAELGELKSPGAVQLRALLADGLTDRSLFGRAAEAFETLSTSGDALTREGLEGLAAGSLDAVDAALAARRAFGVKPPKDADKALAGLRQASKDLTDAEVSTATREAQAAGQGGVPEPEASTVPGLAADLLKGRARAMISGAVASGVTALTGSPLAGTAASMAFGRLGKAWSAASAARVVDSARRFAGVAARPAEVAGVGMGAAGLARFTGEYSSPREAYEARAEQVRAAAQQPELLFQTIAGATGDLGVEAPGFYRELAGTSTRALTYLVQNLPVQTAASMLYPRGLPVTDSQVRQFALLWNAVTAPESVLDALGEGTATPAQIRALEAVHPKLYTQLRDEIVKAVSSAPASVPQQTKVWLDLVFNTDGLAGPSYSLAGGMMLRPPPPMQEPGARGPGITPTQAAQANPQQPLGMRAAQTGPTAGM